MRTKCGLNQDHRAEKSNQSPGTSGDDEAVPIEQYVYLFVEGRDEGPDWLPEELTAALDVEPTEVRRKGEMDSSGRRPARRSTWKLGTERTDEVDTDLLVRSVLDQVVDRAEVFREFVAARDLGAGLEVVITMKA